MNTTVDCPVSNVSDGRNVVMRCVIIYKCDGWIWERDIEERCINISARATTKSSQVEGVGWVR